MQPSTCVHCSAPILWAKKIENGKWNRPLDALTGINGFIIVEGEVHVGTLYQPHTCKPQQVLSTIDQHRLQEAALAERALEDAEHKADLEEKCSQIAENIQEREQRDEQQRKLREEAAENIRKHHELKEKARREVHQQVADKRRCSKCNQKKGDMCINLAYLARTGDKKFTLDPHQERI